MGHCSSILVSVVLLLGGGAARAEPAPAYPLVTDGGGDRPMFARQVVPATTSATSGLAKTRTIYLNRHGATLSPGASDSQTQKSSIVSQVTEVPAWNVSTTDWTATVTCMKAMWSRFDVVVTDVDPGTTPHVEALFAGSPADVGLSSNIGGVSPFTTDCSVIEHSIVFAFTNNLPKRPQVICEVMSQEVAHSYGLDHEMLASDPMTYLSYSGNRQFQDQMVACGETKERPCGISGSTCRPSQNSFQLLLARLGAANRDDQPPSVAITAPAETTPVAAGFTITATATDNVAIASVAFYLDGDLLATRTQAPFELVTDAAIVLGAHTIVVEATDADGNATTDQRDITVGRDTAAASKTSPNPLGCSTTGQPPFAMIGIVVGALLVRRRNPR